MSELVAVDTNILIYLHDSDLKKKAIAEKVLSQRPRIFNQVISEYLNVTRRVLNLPKADLLIKTAELFSNCDITPVLFTTLVLAAELTRLYHFQLFDSIIVASALEEGCHILYSEDMHHGLIVNNKLSIVNPFIQ